METGITINFEATPGTIGSSFFPKLEGWVNNISEPYLNQVITEDGVKEAKETLADLRKTYSNLEAERKALKKTWNAPYEEWEAKYKAAVSSLNLAIDRIDGQVKAFEKADAERRFQLIKEAIFKDARDFGKELGEVVQFPVFWKRVYKDAYANKTASINKITLEWRQALMQILNELKSIGDDQELKDEYLDCADLALATIKVAENKARRQKMAALAPNPKPEPIPEPPRQTAPQLSQDDLMMASMTRTYIGPKHKLMQLLKYAEELGLEVRKTK